MGKIKIALGNEFSVFENSRHSFIGLTDRSSPEQSMRTVEWWTGKATLELSNPSLTAGNKYTGQSRPPASRLGTEVSKCG